jgi:zinc transport system ATP-binding protein
MIELENVSFSFPDIEVLNNVSFKLDDGEFIGILGPNGGGKSTFLKLVLGLLKPQTGKVRVSDENIAYISQTTSLNDSSFPATVKEIVSLGLVKNKPFFVNYKKNQTDIETILKEMDLWDLRNKLISELSGGQLQRVKIAKALVGHPTLIVLDEPDAGMDEKGHTHLINVINKLHNDKVSILFVSHHPHDLEQADKIFFIENGEMLTYEHELDRGHHHVTL